MIDLITQVLIILFTGTVFGWIFRRVIYSSFIGYIVGGFIISILFTSFGVGIPEATEFEFLKNLGLVIFSFEAGLSIGIEKLLKSLNRILVIELISYPLLWVSARVISNIINLSIVEEMLLFLILMNSSSVLAITLAKTISNYELRVLTALQTHFEDTAQFIIFSVIFIAGIPRPTIEGIAIDMLKIIGLLTLLAYVLLKILEKLRGFILRMDSSSKYLLFLSIALLYSTITQNLGLPALLGSFIAGIVLSEFTSSEDFTILSGIREFGLLLYFSSLGLQLTSPQHLITTSQLLIGIIVGVLTVLIRTTTISLGSMLGALDPKHILLYAATLSSVSEIAIVFSDVLATQGVIPISFRVVVTLIVITSIITSSITYKKIMSFEKLIILILPKKLNQLISSLSSLLLHSSNLIIEVSKDLTKFLIVLLTAIYALNVIVVVSEYIPVFSTVLIMLSMSVCYIAILTVFAKTIESVYGRLLKEITSIKSSGWREATIKFITIVISVLSIALLITTSHTIITEVYLPTELHTLLIIIINITTISLLIYITLRELRKMMKT